MKILGISGSPRIGGNTDILLDRALEGARSAGANVEKIILNNLNFSPCQECENLKDDGSCIIEDDMQLVYKNIESADGLILASPVFFGSLSAQAKMMIDRFQCAWRAKYILKKDIFSASARGGCAFGTKGGSPARGWSASGGASGGNKKKKGAFICVAASDRKDFFNNSKMIVKNLFVTINVKYIKDIFCPDVDKKRDVLKHEEFLKKAYKLGEEIAKPEVL